MPDGMLIKMPSGPPWSMAISIRPQARAKPINVPISKETSSTTKKDYLMMFILILYSGVLKNNAKNIPEL